MRRLLAKLAAKYDRVHCCHEAGPTGYGLHRLITELGHTCIVVAPSLIPRKPSDRVKLTSVWVPDPAHEAMRNLIRARAAAVETVRVHK
jgi:transposase